jgi:DNA polymerase-3 subunit delta'
MSGPELLPPRKNPLLLGHEGAERELIAAFSSGRAPHAWIFAGPRGIGKATLAFRLARWLLSGGADQNGGGLFGPAALPESLAVPETSPVFQRVASGGHADLLSVQRELNDRGELKKEIAVDDVRRIEPFLRLTAAEGGWRAVVLDEADFVNRSSANALLKILEEPPPRAVLMLICENPGALLPTIRSRCRTLRLAPLGDVTMRELLRRAAPDLNGADLADLLALAQGSIGRAIDLIAAEGLSLHRQVKNLLGRVPGLSPGDALAAGEALGRPGSDTAYRVFTSLLLDELAGLAKQRARDRTHTNGVLATLDAPALLELWADLQQRFREADWGNLDKRQVILTALLALDDAAAGKPLRSSA